MTKGRRHTICPSSERWLQYDCLVLELRERSACLSDGAILLGMSTGLLLVRVEHAIASIHFSVYLLLFYCRCPWSDATVWLPTISVHCEYTYLYCASWPHPPYYPQGKSYEETLATRKEHVSPGYLTYYKNPILIHQVRQREVVSQTCICTLCHFIACLIDNDFYY